MTKGGPVEYICKKNNVNASLLPSPSGPLPQCTGDPCRSTLLTPGHGALEAKCHRGQMIEHNVTCNITRAAGMQSKRGSDPRIRHLRANTV